MLVNAGKVQDGSINATISSQWLAENNTIFQQIVVENTGNSSIDDFCVMTNQHMLIRDLDYLSSYQEFNENDSAGYIRGRGPNDFSWITANAFESGKIATSQEIDTNNTPASEFKHIGNGVHSAELKKETLENNGPASSPRDTSGESRPRTASSQAAVGRENADMKVAGVDQHRHSAKERISVGPSQGHDPDEIKLPPSDDELWQKRSIADTWSAKDARAVVSIMNLYVDGEAQKLGMEPRPIHKTIGAAGSSASVLEITVAYRMIAIPKGKIHWKNFLIPARSADVSAMLAKETEQIWGHSISDDCKCSQSLCDLGISMVDLKEPDMKQDESDEDRTSQIPPVPSDSAQKSKGMDNDTATVANLQTDVKTGEILTAAKTSKKSEAARTLSAAPVTSTAVGNSEKLPPINFIEYLTWRHTEHILSVCVIPLSSPLLIYDEEAFGPKNTAENVVRGKSDILGTSNCNEDELGVPLALTCGDMSGHRVCTSASL